MSSINYSSQGKYVIALAIIGTDIALGLNIILKVGHLRMVNSLKIGKIGKTGFLNGRSRSRVDDGIYDSKTVTTKY